jgi:DNA-binding MarR family transcriptional regulator
MSMSPLPSAKKTGRPVPRDVKEALTKIRETDFWLCVQFADTLLRYIEITMKQDIVISRLQGSALYFLLLKGGVSTPSRLAKAMLRSKHSVTKIIDSLEKEGLITRSFTSRDRRVTSIKLTAAGLEHLKHRFERGNERAAKVMGCLSAAEQKELAALTERMRKRMNKILESL